MRLEGKVAIVTGAGNGIGRASARLFAREGARVVCADLVADDADRTSEEIQQAGGDARAVQVDVSQAVGAAAMTGTALDAFGRIDILFNVAGTGIFKSVHELEESEWDFVMDTNVKSVFLCSRAVLPQFMEQGWGNIINTASTLGLLAVPRYPAYCASKAAIIQLTRQMALDYGPNVRVNCICPGATDTPRMRRAFETMPDPEAAARRAGEVNAVMKRLARPEEIAYSALYLASEEASFVTGSALVVDGGQTIDA
jgi:3-oxoacyl-[acyl-carrier protein] reductase